MTKNAMSVAKGVAAVVATGVVVGYVSNKVMQKNPILSRWCRCIRNTGTT